MVNYCCVQGCGRNSKQNKHLNYYSLPKEKRRQVQWLQAAGRNDLLEKDKVLVSHRFCSRHFPPSAIKNRHLCDTAVPTLCLPGSWSEDDEQQLHKGIICDSCGVSIRGFRYKCVSCSDLDLCQQCEMRETHREHYMLRMPKPLKFFSVPLAKGIICDSCGVSIQGFRYKCVSCSDLDLCQQCEARETHREHYMLRMPEPLKFKMADNLIQKWQSFFHASHPTPSDSDEDKYRDSDDEPITKYVKNYDSGIDLPEDVKETIRDEVARVLALPERQNKSPPSKRKMGEDVKKPVKRIKMDGTGYEDRTVPEVAFADVNAHDNLMEVKNEIFTTEDQALVHVKLSDDLTELMIEMAPHRTNT